jgi:hypothetical protein
VCVFLFNNGKLAISDDVNVWWDVCLIVRHLHASEILAYLENCWRSLLQPICWFVLGHSKVNTQNSSRRRLVCSLAAESHRRDIFCYMLSLSLLLPIYCERAGGRCSCNERAQLPQMGIFWQWWRIRCKHYLPSTSSFAPFNIALPQWQIIDKQDALPCLKPVFKVHYAPLFLIKSCGFASAFV